MTPLSLFLGFVSASAWFEPVSLPSVFDLEMALRGTRGDSFGSDSPSPHDMLLSMNVKDVPDDLLLAVLLSGATGNFDPVDTARNLLAESSFDVTRLREPSLWQRTKGVGSKGRARVVAALELARRVDVRDVFSRRKKVISPESAVEYFQTMSMGPYEALSILFLDRVRRVIGGRVITIGSSQFTVVDPSQIYREALEMGASAVILAHNHPSGDPTPSTQDREVTNRVAAAGRVVGVPLLDHIVLGASGKWISLAQEGLLPLYGLPPPTWTAEPSGDEP